MVAAGLPWYISIGVCVWLLLRLEVSHTIRGLVFIFYAVVGLVVAPGPWYRGAVEFADNVSICRRRQCHPPRK